MKNTQSITRRALRALTPALALGGAALLLAPAGQSFGFSTLGTALNVGSERDWRMHNIFADTTANNNATPDANYPGYLGATQAMWKAAAEWGSRPHGSGLGDPTQGNIGDGGANFDFFFGGEATGSGNNRKIVSVIPSCGGGGTLAYVTNGGNSWNMTFCDEWTWADGPGTIGNQQFDIQSVGCHELGHSLGLGHSGTFAATMFGSISNGSEAQRSIHSDDIAGVQSIYGVADAGKPIITGVSIDLPGNTITIFGSNFAATGNDVWFTSSFPTAPNVDPRVIVSGVDSPSGNLITLSLPGTAGDGDVHVRNDLAGGAGLSNGWPVDLEGASGPTLEITSFTPNTVECLIVGPGETVTMSGVGFTASTTVTIDGVPLDPALYTYVDSTTITLEMPQVSSLGAIPVQIDDGALSTSSTIQVVAPSGPLLQIGNGLDLGSNVIPSAMGLDVIYAGPPGAFHYVLYSSSNLPSSIPLVSLCIGNNFSDLGEVTNGIIGAAGYNQLNLPLPSIFAAFFFQSISFSQGTPIPGSNCQEALITF